VRYEGIRGLYQGLTPALLGSSLSWGGYFFLYEGLKNKWMANKEQKLLLRQQGISTSSRQPMSSSSLGPMENFCIACTAGAAMVIVTNPIWLIKTRMQLQLQRVQEMKFIHQHQGVEGMMTIKAPYHNMVDAARTIIREEGPMALYKGAVPAMMLTSHGGVQFVVYEFMKEHFGNYTKSMRTQQAIETNNTSATNEQESSTSGATVALERMQDSLGYLTMGGLSKM